MMKNFFSNISKSILYFISGMFFTLFLLMIVVVVILYTETDRLRREIDDLKFPKAIQEMPAPTQTKKIEDKFPQNVVEEEPEPQPQSASAVPRGIAWGNWNNLKENLTADEVVNLLGSPTQIISLIDTNKYIYKDGNYEGHVEFNRKMRVISWNRLQ